MSEDGVTEAVTEAQMTRPVLLKQARESAGLHIAALAAALKVPVRKLEALEAGRYDELPDLTFARALASSACRHLKVDPAPVLAQLPASSMPRLGDKGQAINAPFKTAQDAPASSPWGWLSRPAVLGAIALLLGALVILFLPSVGPAPEPEVVTAPVLQPDPAPAPASPGAGIDNTAPAGAPSADVALPPAPGAAAPETSAATDAAAAAPVVAPAAPTESQGATGASQTPLLSLFASDTSWVEVVNGTGTVVLQRNLQAGERLEFSAAPPYSVVLGRAEAVQVSVRGRILDTQPLVRNNVARFEVK